MMRLIGITGYKGSGKGEAASAVARLLPNSRVKEVGFADKVKIMAARAAGWSGPDEVLLTAWNNRKGKWNLIHWDTENEQRIGSMTERQYIQHLGHGARLTFGDDFWVNQVLPATLLSSHETEVAMRFKYPCVDVLVMPDLRYENEAQRVLDLGGVIWEVIRPGVTSDGHDSEQRLPPDLVSWQLFNDAGIDQLEDHVREALAKTC